MKTSAIVFMMVARSVCFHGMSSGAGAPDIRAVLDPVGSAEAKIAEAHRLMLTQRPLDMMRWSTLLGNAHKQTPMLDKEIAHEFRALAILWAGIESSDFEVGLVGTAVEFNHRLAFEDTVSQICRIYGSTPPLMTKLLAEKKAKEPKPKPTGPTKVVVVPYRPLPADTLMPNYGRGVGSLGRENWPRVLERTAPRDPRGPGEPAMTVVVRADLDREGRISETNVETGGVGELGPTAEAAVREWRIQPLMIFGHPVKCTVQIPVTFAATSVKKPMKTQDVSSSQGTPDREVLPKFGEYVYIEELPEAVVRVPPIYPAIAREANVAGVVMVQALVGKDGKVRDTRVVKSIPMLDGAAVDAVRQWVFNPAKAAGKPVAVWVAVPVRFPPQ